MMNLASGLTIQDKAAYLRTLPSIRERCGRVHDLAKDGKLEYFEYHPEKEKDVTEFCIGIMKARTVTDIKTHSSSLALVHPGAQVSAVLNMPP
jgi:hypothetical protein